MSQLIGIDVGTSGAKAVLLDGDGTVIRSATASYGLSTPQPGWAEQNPEDWWEAVRSCLDQLSAKPDAIGLTGQMHGSVFLDRDGSVLRPAILWCDQRTSEQCDHIDRVCGAEQVRRTTLNPPLTGFQLPKILWLRDNEPDTFKLTKRVLLPKDYVRYRMTGEYSTDVSDASGVGAFDVPGRTWATRILDQLGLDPGLFPTCHESIELSGESHEGVSVVAGAGDQAAGAVGVGAVLPGVTSVSIGTSGVAFTSLDFPAYDSTESTHVFCHANGAWHAMGVMLCCCGALDWVNRTIFPDLTIAEMESLALCSRDDGSVPLFLPYLTGERCPVVDPNALGAFAGLSISTGREEVARSAFEAAASGLASCVEAVGRTSVPPERLLVTGGGARSDLLVQMLADLTGIACVRVSSESGPSVGAAILAGVGAGVWSDIWSAVACVVQPGETLEPQKAAEKSMQGRHFELYSRLKGWSSQTNTLK